MDEDKQKVLLCQLSLLFGVEPDPMTIAILHRFIASQDGTETFYDEILGYLVLGTKLLEMFKMARDGAERIKNVSNASNN
jgi:hypothetical protein